MKISGFMLAATLAISPTGVGGDGSTKGIPIDKVMRIADVAIGYPQGRPDNFEIVTVKLFFSKLQDLAHEGIPGDPKESMSKLHGKEYWLVQYRKWPARLDAGLAVIVDAQSGEVLNVLRDR